MFKRIFLLVLDSLGVGEAIDANQYNDTGANTLKHINDNHELFIPNLKKLGFLNTINMSDNEETEAYYTIAKPTNIGKDSLTAHYELMGIRTTQPFKLFTVNFISLSGSLLIISLNIVAFTTVFPSSSISASIIYSIPNSKS